MSIDKFGSHIFGGKDVGYNFPTETVGSETKTLKFVDINNVKLFYNLVLPFLGVFNAPANAFELLQDKRVKYDFPLDSAIIMIGEYPRRDVMLKINGETVDRPEGFKLKKGDVISFHRTFSQLPEFYGELLIKCPVEIEKQTV